MKIPLIILLASTILLVNAGRSYAKGASWVECVVNAGSKDQDVIRYKIDPERKTAESFNSKLQYKVRSLTDDYIVFGTKMKMTNKNNSDLEITIGRKDFSYHSRYKPDENMEDNYSDEEFMKAASIAQGECKKITAPEILF